jgi:hypothetical protein
MEDDNDEIWVCTECLQASCWAGIFMCQESRTANIKKITKGEARKLKVEHEDYINLPEVQAK